MITLIKGKEEDIKEREVTYTFSDEDIKCYKDSINHCKNKINRLSEDIKEKIAKDAITYKKLAMNEIGKKNPSLNAGKESEVKDEN